MDMIDQYLRAVAALLPRAQRADITAELRDTILSRIEAREDGLGYRLSDDEIEAELRALGHPIVVAARYRDEPQHVVGPSIYPYWMFAVKVAVAIQATAVLVLLIANMATGQELGNAMARAVDQGMSGFATLIGVATVVAWAIEHRKIHVAYLHQWRVRDLRVLEYAGWDFTDLLDHFRRGQRLGRPVILREVNMHRSKSPISQGLFMITFGAMFLLWWAGVIHLPLFDQATGHHGRAIDTTLARMSLSDVHSMLFWPVLVYAATVIVQGVLLLIYPNAFLLRSLVAFLMGAALLSFCVWAWTAAPFAPALHVDSLADLLLKLKQDFHNRPIALAPVFTLFLGCVAFGAVINIVQGLWKMLLLLRQDC